MNYSPSLKISGKYWKIPENFQFNFSVVLSNFDSSKFFFCKIQRLYSRTAFLEQIRSQEFFLKWRMLSAEFMHSPFMVEKFVSTCIKLTTFVSIIGNFLSIKARSRTSQISHKKCILEYTQKESGKRQRNFRKEIWDMKKKSLHHSIIIIWKDKIFSSIIVMLNSTFRFYFLQLINCSVTVSARFGWINRINIKMILSNHYWGSPRALIEIEHKQNVLNNLCENFSSTL